MKKILSLILSIIISFSTTSSIAFAIDDASQITVYMTVSKHGELVKDKYGNVVAFSEVVLEGKENYNLNDAFAEFHNTYYEGEEGYAFEESEYGPYVTEFLNDVSGNFSYQLNQGSEMVMGLNHEIEDGDTIDFSINKNYYPDTESYAVFKDTHIETFSGKEIEIELNQSGYDENFNLVFSSCPDATIIIDGEKTEIVTDAEGKAKILIDNPGRYVVSATKSKIVKEKTVPAITAPACIIDVEKLPIENMTEEIVKNIAEKYSQAAILDDGNMMWFVPDMAVYSELYPESEYYLDDDIKKQCLDKIVTDAESTTSPAVLSKIIISLRSMGYDAENIYYSNGEELNVVEKLIELVEKKESSVTNIYTLPYVILALLQSKNYATEEHMDFLIDTAIEKKESWQSTQWGTDAATPMLLALSPYYNIDEEVTTVIEETIEIIKECQEDSGLIGNAASTGLAIAAFSALGIDAFDVKKDKNSLIDGLISQATEDMCAFNPTTNSFSTEQGFRGLLSWYLMKNQKQKRMYDFSSYPMEKAYATKNETCRVMFSTTPNNANLTIDGQTPVDDGEYELAEGKYEYIVSKSGYKTKNSSFEVTKEDIKNQTKTITVELNKKSSQSSGGSSGGIIPAIVKKDTQTDEEEKEEIQKEPDFIDVNKEAWYYEAVKYVYNNLLMEGTGSGFEPDMKMTRAMFAAVLYRMEGENKTEANTKFSDVLKGSWYENAVAWALEKNIISGVSETEFAPDKSISREQIAVIMYRYSIYKGKETNEKSTLEGFEDKEEISDWAYDAMCWANACGIMNGTSQSTISPKETATRAQVAQIIYNIFKDEQ